MRWECHECAFTTDHRDTASDHSDQTGHPVGASLGRATLQCTGSTLASCSKRFENEDSAEDHVRQTGHGVSEFLDGLPTDFQLWASDTTAAVYDNADTLRGQGKVEGRDFRLLPRSPGITPTDSERALKEQVVDLQRRNEELVERNTELYQECNALRATVVEQTSELRRLKDG